MPVGSQLNQMRDRIRKTLTTVCVIQRPVKIGTDGKGGALIAYRRVGAIECVQRIQVSGPPTGGDFTLDYIGQMTLAIAFNATAKAVRLALEALSNLGFGQVRTIGGPLPEPIDVIFTGTLSGVDTVLLIPTSSLIDGGVAVVRRVTGETAPQIKSLIETAGNWGEQLYVHKGSGAGGHGVKVSWGAPLYANAPLTP